MGEVVATNETILVVGGGVSGMTAAIEAAEYGKQVILLEKKSPLGGRVSQLYENFPKLYRWPGNQPAPDQVQSQPPGHHHGRGDR